MKNTETYAVMGITGNVAGAAAQALLQAGKHVRGIVRDKGRAAKWEKAGVELVVGDYSDEKALKAAFQGLDGAFVMIPGNFAPSPGFPEAHAAARVLRDALSAAMPPRIVALSSIGAQRPSGLGLITQLHILEETLAPLAFPTTFLRPGWFMENAAWDVAPALQSGAIPGFLHPLDKPIPMVSAADVGRVAAELLQTAWTGRRIMELEGPRDYSPNDLAEAFSSAVGRKISATSVPRSDWETLFKSQGTSDPAPRIEMLDGFNSDWISFEGSAATRIKGQIDLQSVIQALVEQRGK